MSLTASQAWLSSFRSIALASLLLTVLVLSAIGCSPMSPSGNDNAGDDGQTFTVTFDGDEGATSSGTTDFDFNGASFSGGTVMTVGQPGLYGSGLFAYEVLDGSTVIVTFDNPIDSLALFFVTRGAGQTVLTARDADGGEVGTATAAPPNSGTERVTVTLSVNATRVEIVHTGDGDGWIDDFQFKFAGTGGA